MFDNPLMAKLMREGKDGRSMHYLYPNHLEGRDMNPLHKMELLVDGAMQPNHVNGPHGIPPNGPHGLHNGPPNGPHGLADLPNGPHGPNRHNGPANGPLSGPHGFMESGMAGRGFPKGAPGYMQGYKMQEPPDIEGQMNMGPMNNMGYGVPRPAPHGPAGPHHMMNIEMFEQISSMPSPMLSPGNPPREPAGWNCPEGRKRPKARRKQKAGPAGPVGPAGSVGGLWERLSPCPNVDVRHMAGKPDRAYMMDHDVNSLPQPLFDDIDIHLQPIRTPSAGNFTFKLNYWSLKIVCRVLKIGLMKTLSSVFDLRTHYVTLTAHLDMTQ